MRVKLTIIGALFLSLICVTSASAQYGGYTIQTPGQLPTYVNPTPNGGYMMQTPGQLPTEWRLYDAEARPVTDLC
jgi:hypothetical protein